MNTTVEAFRQLSVLLIVLGLIATAGGALCSCINLWLQMRAHREEAISTTEGEFNG